MEDDPLDANVDKISRCVSQSFIPIRNTNPQVADDLEPLRDRLTGMTVVGLGESTHGTREFFRLKHRLFKFLVEELGYRLFAWEANFAATLPINEFVQHGRSNLTEHLSNESIHWPLRSEAVVELLTWVRAFNEGRDPKEQVKVYGFDMQYPSDAASTIRSFLKEVNSDLLADIRTDIDKLSDSGAVEMFNPEEREALVDSAAQVVALEDLFEKRMPAYVEVTSRSMYERARQCLRTLSQWVDQQRGKNPLRARDEAMAENISWILDHESADKIAIWGHNAHIKRGNAANGAIGIDAPSMGEHLHQRYGQRYYALGFEFGQGSFRAHSLADNEFRIHTIESPPSGSIPDVFGTVDESRFIFELDQVSTGSALADWLETNPERHMIVGSYDEDPVEYVESNLGDSFDGLAFIAETTPTTPTEHVYPELDVPATSNGDG